MRKLVYLFVFAVLFISACTSDDPLPVIVSDCGVVTENSDCNTRDCLENSCFLEAAKECSPASIVHIKESSDAGFTTRSVIESSILGFEGDRCVVESEILSYDRGMTDHREGVIYRIYGQEGVDDIMRSFEEESLEMTGLSGACYFDLDVLWGKVDSVGFYEVARTDGVTYSCIGDLYFSEY